jgi:hypothetical protein
MRIDNRIEPVTEPHFCNKAYIADVNCLLKHYKFTNNFEKRIEYNLENYCYYAQIEHKQYNKVLKDKGYINLYSNTAKKFNTVNELIDLKFLKVSNKYLKFVEENQ